jgi:Domain of unknown function (DUF4326)
MTTELINLHTKDKDDNGRSGYAHYKAKYGDRFEYIGCAIDIFNTHVPGSIWCNPYHGQLKKLGRQRVVQLYREYIINNTPLLAKISTLQGKILACWCAPKLCHGNVLIELLINNI